MKIVIELKRLRFYLWVGFAYLVIWMFVALAQHPDTFFPRCVNEFVRVCYFTAANYLFFEYTLPRLSTRHILRSIALVVLQILIFSWGLYAWRELTIRIGIYTPYKTYPSIEHGVSDQFGASLLTVCFFGIIRHIYNYTRLKQAAQQLRIEKQQAELNYLKAQTNPHFLFNTLNNIYALARDKSDLAPESILRLSKILRFMLYETGGAYINIEKEVKVISDYIALEKLRYDESLRVDFRCEVADGKLSLPPLLLIPLVENAFKHGVSETRSGPYVEIRLSAQGPRLFFSVKNSTDPLAGGRTLKENIGLSNLRRQLELLYTDYQLSVQQGVSDFTALLQINLASHV